MPTSEPVEVIHFPKLCPKCGVPVHWVYKFSGAKWWECRNEKCEANNE